MVAPTTHNKVVVFTCEMKWMLKTRRIRLTMEQENIIEISSSTGGQNGVRMLFQSARKVLGKQWEKSRVRVNLM